MADPKDKGMEMALKAIEQASPLNQQERLGYFCALICLSVGALHAQEGAEFVEGYLHAAQTSLSGEHDIFIPVGATPVVQ